MERSSGRLSLVSVSVIVLLLAATSGGPPAAASPVGGLGQVRYGVSQQKGFDTCTAPSLSTMQQWWTYSPYWDIGIYIGGANRGCSQPNLTASWVSSAHSQGWSFYLIWVGPQAPCTSFRSRFSYDTATARQQGRNEADSAVWAAYALGFTGYNVYYYDLEGYNTADTACRDAAKAFVDGWVERIRTYWREKAGVYGAGCSSAVRDWATIANVPDDVWIAHWNNDPDVWGLACVSNSLWVNHQRLHQYAGNVTETWGGVTLLIDRDCADGLVTPHGHGWTDRACTVE
jgi:hypothetical protein